MLDNLKFEAIIVNIFFSLHFDIQNPIGPHNRNQTVL